MNWQMPLVDIRYQLLASFLSKWGIPCPIYDAKIEYHCKPHTFVTQNRPSWQCLQTCLIAGYLACAYGWLQKSFSGPCFRLSRDSISTRLRSWVFASINTSWRILCNFWHAPKETSSACWPLQFVRWRLLWAHPYHLPSFLKVDQ